jgi:hypothetical protein
MEKAKAPFNIYYPIVALFFAAIWFRLSIDGFNLSHPGNLKSVDAFLHAINTDWLAASHQIKNAPFYLANGNRDVIFFHPPLLYLVPAAMSMWTGLEAHNTVWLYSAFAGAFPILIFYLIGERIFDSKRVGILASAIFLLPVTNLMFPELYQLYWAFPSYIGLWNTVLGKTLFAIQLWLVWELWTRPRGWVSLLLGIVTGAQILSHIPETTIVAPLIGAAYFKIMKSDFQGNVRNLLLFAIPSVASLAAFLPKLLGVWLKTKPVVTSTVPSLLENFYFMRIFWTPALILYVIGGFLLLHRRKDNWFWLGVNLYVLMWLGIIPLFFGSDEYFGKLRFVVPLVVFPVVAFGAVKTIEILWKKTPAGRLREGGKNIVFLFVVLVFIASGIAQYNAMKERMSFEEMTKEKYAAMLWVQENTDPGSKILLLDGFNIASGVYSKRVAFQRDWVEYTNAIKDFDAAGQVSTTFQGRWLEEMHNLPYEKTFFSYGYHPLPLESPVGPDIFDYIVMWDFSGEAERYNRAVKSQLGQHGFQQVYIQGGVTIMEKLR